VPCGLIKESILWELVAGGGPGEVVADGAAARPVVAGRKGVPRERGGERRERGGRNRDEETREWVSRVKET
jgi:hypothetical protein